ncbi:hypothetical protein [Streptoalloteichus hindustanus]|uniref:Uncharacterized protein n=1 Tax=Streptoalloteichus hindustanus TaxID=2017 RepID=A0A1M5KPY6_STRHI|nr:hypothetical protein [Streptoalloteichus hindustanus]SHG54776.1 hypothetical protein SAMN05444320_1103 [Streptoalloteichus hindustanus]
MTAWSGPLPGHVGFAESVAVVAQPPTPKPNDPGGRGEDFGKSSPVGLLLLILFFVAVVFLVRSMTKHLKRLPASFDEPAGGTSGDGKSGDGASGPKPDVKVDAKTDAKPRDRGRKNSTGHTATA